MKPSIPIRYCSTDVLVAGGSYAGLLAASKAAELGADVMVMEKAYAGNSGCAKFAAGDIQCFVPELDNLDEWVETMIKLGGNLNSRNWLLDNFPLANKIISRQKELEIPFLLDEDNKIVRKSGRGNIKSAIIDISRSLTLLRKICLSKGVKMLDRVPLMDIIVEDNTIRVAVGLDIRNEQIVVVYCKCLIMATGGCSYKGPYFGMDMDTGDGVAIVFRNGGKLLNMEYANKYQSTYKDFDVCGMNRFAAYGGVFKNNLGECFMEKYDPVFKDAAPLSTTAKAFYEEIKQGRGPVYFDLSKLKPEDRIITQDFLKPLMRAIESSNIDFFEQPLEWIPSFTGSVGASSAGLWVDNNYQTSIKNLFAVGDAASKADYIGAAVGIGGVGLMFAALSGTAAGEKATLCSSNISLQDKHVEQWIIQQKIDNILAPYERENGITSDQILYKIQEILFMPEYSLVKNGHRMSEALNKIRGIKSELPRISAATVHDIMKERETNNMLLLAEAFLKASDERKETRGGHFRDDYPSVSHDWQKRITVSCLNEGMLIEYEDI